MHQRSGRALLGTLVWMVLLSVPGRADTIAPPRSYTVTSPDGRSIFAMLSPREDDDIQQPLREELKAVEVRMRYPRSGLYRNDGSRSALWTVAWYAYSVILPSDGVHLIRQWPWASQLSDEALTFFANGRELRTYRVKDLVDVDWFLPHSVSHFEWENTESFDDKTGTLKVVTFYNDEYVFDVTTGSLVSSKRRSRRLVAAGTTGVLVLPGSADLVGPTSTQINAYQPTGVQS